MANLWLYAAAAIVVLIPTGIAELILLFTDRLLAEVIVWTIASVVSMPLVAIFTLFVFEDHHRVTSRPRFTRKRRRHAKVKARVMPRAFVAR